MNIRNPRVCLRLAELKLQESLVDRKRFIVELCWFTTSVVNVGFIWNKQQDLWILVLCVLAILMTFASVVIHGLAFIANRNLAKYYDELFVELTFEQSDKPFFVQKDEV